MNSQQPSAFNLSPPPTQLWQPVLTTNFNAIAGRAYPVNTTNAAVTVTLPLSPNPGDLITLTDYAGTWGTNNLTINPNGGKINGFTANGTVSTSRGAVSLVYVDSTQGWISYASNLATSITQFKATGGNEIKIVGSYAYHIFTSSGTFTPLQSLSIDVTACGGGGGGGSNAAGGGGGGELDIWTAVSATASGYTVTVGAKGSGAASLSLLKGGNGGISSFVLGGTTHVSSLGGGGGAGSASGNGAGTGGSGGGGSNDPGTSGGGGASGSNTNTGGNGASGSNLYLGGGGGGATTGGVAASTGTGAAGNGGAGYTLTTIDANLTSANFTSFSGMTVICSGGGGGALRVPSGTAPTRGTGGTGAGSGGVNNGNTNVNTASAATSYGSGGGGGGWGDVTPNNGAGGDGYDGIVIVRYLI